MRQDLDSRYRWFVANLKVKGNETNTFTYRALTRKEQKKLSSIKDEEKCETFVLKTCVQSNINLEEIPVGTHRKLIQLITKVSGLDEENLPFKEAKEWIESDLGCIEAAALATIPGCSLEALDNMDISYYFKYLIEAQVLFKSIYQIDPKAAFSEQAARPPQAPLLSQQQQPGRQPTIIVENQGTIVAKKK